MHNKIPDMAGFLMCFVYANCQTTEFLDKFRQQCKLPKLIYLKVKKVRKLNRSTTGKRLMNKFDN